MDANTGCQELIAAAMVKVQAEIKIAKKDKINPFFKSKYADLSSVWEACHEELTKNEIAVIQSPVFRDGVQLCRTVLLHSSGQELSGEYLVRPIKDDPQGYGSAFTYARRYSLASMVGILQDDDDARIASLTRGGKTANMDKIAGKLKSAAKDAEPIGEFVSKAEASGLFKAWKAAGIPNEEVAEYFREAFGIESTERLRREHQSKVIAWITQRANKK